MNIVWKDSRTAPLVGKVRKVKEENEMFSENRTEKQSLEEKRKIVKRNYL